MTDLIEIDGLRLAPAWLDAFSAASQYESVRPMLDMAINVEIYPTGAMLIGTDGTILVSAWAPIDEHEPRPELEEPPSSSWVVSDWDKRGQALMKFAHKAAVRAAKEVGRGDWPINLAIMSGESANQPTLDASLDRHVMQITSGDETLRLPLVEGDWVNWRPMLGAPRGPRPAEFGFAGPLLKRMGSLNVGALHLTWREWSGAAMLHFESVETGIEGVAMPTLLPGQRPAVDDDGEPRLTVAL